MPHKIKIIKRDLSFQVTDCISCITMKIVTVTRHKKGEYTFKKILLECSYGEWPNKKELVSQLTQ